MSKAAKKKKEVPLIKKEDEKKKKKPVVTIDLTDDETVLPHSMATRSFTVKQADSAYEKALSVLDPARGGATASEKDLDDAFELINQHHLKAQQRKS